ncbi:MAG: hypothetical protein GEU86_12505 [Actinophytocola sp.]|nr:hypothetical protein [Actinophytocola sp.]
MHAERFRKLLESSLADVSDDITVETYEVPSVQQPVLRCADGTAFFLMVVHTGDNSEPEHVVERGSGTQIEVTTR